MPHNVDGGGGTPATAFLDSSIAGLARLGYQRVKDLGKGSFGSVVLVRDQKSAQSAMKIVVPDQVSVGEVKIWPTVRHPNILPLTQIIPLPQVASVAFKMPVLERSLEQILECPDFRNSPSALHLTTKFCQEIADGLVYLHARGLVHMDLKTNNVLISTGRKAVICDFTFLTTATEPIRNYGTPLHLRPPEACPTKGKCVPVHGPSFEAWTYGLLALDAFTRHLTWKLPGKPQNWSLQTYPVLYKFLQEDFFLSRVRSCFPGTDLPEVDAATIRNYVVMFLTLRPEDRPSLAQAAQHRLFVAGGAWTKEDRLWTAPKVATPAFRKQDPAEEEEAAVRNFVAMFLALKPEDRPRMAQAARHLFGTQDDLAQEDQLWTALKCPHQSGAGEDGPADCNCNYVAVEPKPMNLTYVAVRYNPSITNRTYVVRAPSPVNQTCAKAKPYQSVITETYALPKPNPAANNKTYATKVPNPAENNKTYIITGQDSATNNRVYETRPETSTANRTYAKTRANPAENNRIYVITGPDQATNNRICVTRPDPSNSNRTNITSESIPSAVNNSTYITTGPNSAATNPVLKALKKVERNRKPEQQIHADFVESEDKEPLLGRRRGRFRGALKWIRRKAQKMRIR